MLNVEEKSEAFLESSVKNFKIFIDACSLLSDRADIFWTRMVPILEREKKSMIIPLRVYQEVKKYADDPVRCQRKSDPNLNQRAKDALKSISTLQKAGLVNIYGDEHDNFADNVFQTVFTQFRLKYNLMLITEDYALASDIITIEKSKSVKTKNRILVERINKDGYLSLFYINDKQSSIYQRANSSTGYARSESIANSECFAFATTVQKVTGKMTVSSLPSEGATLTAVRNEIHKTVKLIKMGSSGGEGTIYTTNVTDIVAKIYKPEKLDRAKFEKLKLMMTKSIDCEGVCFPLALLYNQKNEFVGYLMKKAKGKELQRCVFIPQLLSKNFPKWNKIDTVTLCVTILKKLLYLHERNVILGDINPNNILVVSPTEVYFVDTDSYQIEGYPCPVGTINYTAPEIQRKEYSTFLRTMGNEYFAVATLLFMIMLPGKPPYSLQGGENQIDNIIKGDFAYASGSRSTGKAPEGMWRFCWSHLPRYLKDDFYETFRKGGTHSTEKTRYSTEDWLDKFEYYLELLTSGKLAKQDSMSMAIFPTRLKKNPKSVYVRCRLCGNEVDEEQTEQGICQSCLNKGEIYHCAQCGCEMIYTNYQKYIKHSHKYEICRDCYNKKNTVYAIVKCSECGESFKITYGEKEFYERKGFQLPKKCKNCRGQRTYVYSNYSDEDNDDTSSFHFKKPSLSDGGFLSGCFITTAACEYFGKADDCYELTLLRQFRDGWLAIQPGGENLIKEYYKVAPLIVDRLNSNERRDEIYREIWNCYILPCIQFIEQNAYESCRKLYEEMVQKLQQTILKES